MNDAELSELYTEVVRARANGDRADCPSVDALDALVQRRGDEASRVATLDHAMACEACKHELELLRSIHVATPVARFAVPRWASFAAAVVLVAGLATWATLRPPAREPTRGADAPGAGVAAIQPIELPASGGARQLVWHALAGATRYRVEVLAADGTVVDTASVADTVFTLPSTTLLAPGAAFDWWVSAQLPDGRVLRSPLVRASTPR